MGLQWIPGVWSCTYIRQYRVTPNSEGVNRKETVPPSATPIAKLQSCQLTSCTDTLFLKGAIVSDVLNVCMYQSELM